MGNVKVISRNLTKQDRKAIREGIKACEKNRDKEMRLHQKPISEFMKMTVEDRRQALIEWKLQYTAPFLIYDQNNELCPRWQFLMTQTPQERGQMVKAYEDYIDSLRDHPRFENEMVKNIVEERRRALNEAVARNSDKTLNEILSFPGFERYAEKRQGKDTYNLNMRGFELISANVSYPPALLYNLFNDPPDFLSRTQPLPKRESPKKEEYHLKVNLKEVFCNEQLLGLTPQQTRLILGVITQKNKRYWLSKELYKILYGSMQPYAPKYDNKVLQAVLRLSIRLEKSKIPAFLVYEKAEKRYKVPSEFTF